MTFCVIHEIKKGLIEIIATELAKVNCTVIQSGGAADVDIVKAALHSARSKQTVLIGEDTDLLILLLFHCSPDMCPIYFRTDKHKPSHSIYNIQNVKMKLGVRLYEKLLFLQAFTGWDTTSRVYGVGKKSAFQKRYRGDAALNASAEAIFK